MIDVEKSTKRISPDGHCGFNAAATAIFGNEGRRDQVITDMMTDLQKNKQYYIDLKFDILYLEQMLEGASKNPTFLPAMYWFNGTHHKFFIVCSLRRSLSLDSLTGSFLRLLSIFV